MKKSKNNIPKLSEEDKAKQVLEEAEKKRSIECSTEIKAVLLKYGYALTTRSEIIFTKDKKP